VGANTAIPTAPKHPPTIFPTPCERPSPKPLGRDMLMCRSRSTSACFMSAASADGVVDEDMIVSVLMCLGKRVKQASECGSRDRPETCKKAKGYK
jgi:hypothetical protein